MASVLILMADAPRCGQHLKAGTRSSVKAVGASSFDVSGRITRPSGYSMARGCTVSGGTVRTETQPHSGVCQLSIAHESECCVGPSFA